MSRAGLEAAMQAGERLPAFPNLQEARVALLALRDTRLRKFESLAQSADHFSADASPESLKPMEAWYFELISMDGFSALAVSRNEFEECMAMYFCHVVAVTHADAEWVIEDSPFVPGHYSIGVRRGHITWASSFRFLHKIKANKRRTAIYRDYKKYFGRD